MFAKNSPFFLKIIASLCQKISFIRSIVEKATYKRLEKLATQSKNGTVYWYKTRNDRRNYNEKCYEDIL